MTFLWPTMLWAMLALPVVVALYVFLITRRKKTTLRYANLGLVKEALARAGVDTLELGTDDDLVDAVLRFSDLKKQRSRLANWTGPAHRSIAHVRPVAQAPAGSPR
jgi:hypothetical protein